MYNEDKNKEQPEIDMGLGNEIELEMEAKVLIVDDDPLISKLISNYLEYMNIKVIHVTSGRDALKLIGKESELNLVILDLVLPDMTGYHVCRKIREKFSLYELPVLMLTVKNEVHDVISGFEAGANDYLSKPFDRLELIARSTTLIKLHKLIKTNESLQEAINMKNSVMEMTIHDLRNPLSVIDGIAHLLIDDEFTSEKISELLKIITDSSGLMMHLINEMLEVAKLESGKITLKKEDVWIDKIIQYIHERNIPHAKRKGQEIVVNKNLNEKTIYTDSSRLTEILDNIFNNAVKFTQHKGKIEFRVNKINKYDKSFVRFEIQDNGPGLTHEDKKKIFRRFQRLSAQPTAGEPSTGLGLSIVKKLVHLLDGRITVVSEMGEGCNFIIDMPILDKM